MADGGGERSTRFLIVAAPGEGGIPRVSGNLRTIASQDGQGRSVDKVHRRVKAQRCRAFPSHCRVYLSTKEYSV